METKTNPHADHAKPEIGKPAAKEELKSRKDRLMALRARMYAQHPQPVLPPDMVELIDLLLDN